MNVKLDEEVTTIIDLPSTKIWLILLNKLLYTYIEFFISLLLKIPENC